jgi:carbonic anhydrase
VRAALDAHSSGVTPPGHLRRIVERLTPDVLAARAHGVEDADEIARWHGRGTADEILQESSIVRERVADGRCGIAVLAYRLVDGRTNLVAAHGLQTVTTG